MKINLMELTKNMSITKISNEVYYKFTELIEVLDKIEEKYIEIELENVITPFYIYSDANRYEIYHYELLMFLVNTENFENYILEMTGAKTIKDIDNKIIENYKNRYIEVIKPKTFFLVEDLKKWAYRVYNSKELLEEIKDIFGKFEIENLYFSVY